MNDNSGGDRMVKRGNQKILFICGSMNQTTQMHQIARHLREYELAFTPFFGTGFIGMIQKLGWLEATILGEKLASKCLAYLKRNGLPIDLYGRNGEYDLVFTCSDLIIQKNIRGLPIVLVQEGMTDPENVFFALVKKFPFMPRWIASTSTTGLSRQYTKFCVASEGYRTLFIRKGADPEKVVITGIPNFDNCIRYNHNTFPHHGYVLVCTSDGRETFKFDNRIRLLKTVLRVAKDRSVLFKLHPNENHVRATREIRRFFPTAQIFTEGNAEEMIANCSALVTEYSSTVFVGLALGKECYSYFEMELLNRLMPIQNGGTSARMIADVGKGILSEKIKRKQDYRSFVELSIDERDYSSVAARVMT